MMSLLLIVHCIGLALGIGAASVKLVLLLKSKGNPAYLQVFVKAAKPITQLIVSGLILLTISGIGWLVLGYPFSRKVIVKLIVVGAIWVLGPLIDNVVEPKFNRLLPQPGNAVSFEFTQAQAQAQYLSMEFTATLLFYMALVLGALL